MSTHLKRERYLIALIVITILGVFFHPWFLISSHVIDPRDDHTRRIYDDALNGGASEVRWVDQSKDKWECLVKKGFEYPYCGHELYINSSFIDGVNLSTYKSMRLWLKYEGPTQKIRVFLRNYDPEYSKSDDLESTKYNAIEFEGELLNEEGYLELSFDDFSVSEWWLQKNAIPLRHSHADFKNIVIIEIQTGADFQYGNHLFQLEGVEFNRQLISTQNWYLIIISIWIFLSTVFLFYRIFSSKKYPASILPEENDHLSSLEYLLPDNLPQEIYDPLTGVFNREGVEETLVDALNAWQIEAECFSLILFDVDHFSKINSDSGRTLGDKVLVELAGLISENIEESDYFSRWGGAEFLIVSRNACLAQAMTSAEKLRLLIERNIFSEGVRITASFGVATIETEENLDGVFGRVDEALFKAKRMGRNQILAAD